ncbi:MAG TPA: AAA family ATPase [Mucilaginibacter sp.]
MNNLIILSGPIGAGKTTVARELIKLLPRPTIYMEGDVFWQFIAKGSPRPDEHHHFKITIIAMLAAAAQYGRYDYDVLLDFSITPGFLETMQKMAVKKDLQLHYVVLRPSEQTCALRAATRSEGIIEHYEKYHNLYTAFDGVQQYIVPDDTGEPLAIAEKVQQGLNEGVFLVKQ